MGSLNEIGLDALKKHSKKIFFRNFQILKILENDPKMTFKSTPYPPESKKRTKKNQKSAKSDFFAKKLRFTTTGAIFIFSKSVFTLEKC